MKLRILALCLTASAAQPALSDTLTPSSPPSVHASTDVAFDALLAAGFEVKAVTILSDAAIKEVFANQAGLQSQILITLQHGTALAVCTVSTQNYLSLVDSTMTNTSRCTQR